MYRVPETISRLALKAPKLYTLYDKIHVTIKEKKMFGPGSIIQKIQQQDRKQCSTTCDRSLGAASNGSTQTAKSFLSFYRFGRSFVTACVV